MKRRIAISAGHSSTTGRDNGASYDGNIEGIETVKLRKSLVDEFNKRDIIVNTDDDTNVTHETIDVFEKYFGEHDILIDLHFNAASDIKATGVEVIIPEKYSTMEYSMGYDIAKIIADTIQVRNRGVKQESQSARGKLAWMTMKGETILIEVCFLTNKTDMVKYRLKNKELVSKLVDIISNYKQLQIL